ncbi:alpha/beta hydrolase [Paraburkholderia hayleyella]|uniref:alpha/beta hydrolase n=1 Tax=Paraburkholderia hayleyella TaxID=2152889 RepID=UPI0012911DC3|nr:alpha/beta hydrolase [Paraburkholderia hayleyella]
MLEPEIEAFVASASALYPADAASLPVAQQRMLYERFSATFTAPLPLGVTVRNAVFTAAAGHTVALRAYYSHDCNHGHGREMSSAAGTVLYFHGGGFVLGSLDSHQLITARLAADTGLCVVAVDYRLAPEHPAPAAHDDCLEITLAALAGHLPLALPRCKSLQLAGDSAGGTLAASVAMQLRERNIEGVQGMTLVYPMLGAVPQPPARDTEAHAPCLTLADVQAFRRLYWQDTAPPWTTPLDAARFDGLPSTLAIGVQHDPLRDDAVVFVQRIQATGGRAEIWLGEGLVHGCWRALDTSPGVQRMHSRICAFLRGTADAQGSGLQHVLTV